MLPEPRTLLQKALGLREGETAFPWQEELFQRMRDGEIPDRIDIPTGLGKTSVMAIWLVARAYGGKLPRRLVYVVDRRAVVDQATEVALSLRQFVQDEPGLKEQLGLNRGQPLPISTLRGQFVDNREWLEDPSAPAIIVGTVDMVGSRLLFQGYGVSRKMRPYHAGLLGVDTLVVLDEAHLVPPFAHLLRSIATEPLFRPRQQDDERLIPPFRLLSLSATARERSANAIRLESRDREHEVVKRRLEAKKFLRIEKIEVKEKHKPEDALADSLADRAWKLTNGARNPLRILVYADQRSVCQRARERLEQRAKEESRKSKTPCELETELLVGGRRVFEREQAKEKLRSLGFLAGNEVKRTTPAFLFATSAGEVGIDLDADHMVCDLVAWERMVQRLGRVNRRGYGDAQVVVVEVLVKPAEQLSQNSGNKKKGVKPQEGGEQPDRISAVRKLLELLPQVDSETFDASPGALDALQRRAQEDQSLEQLFEEATTPEPLRPALSLPLVEAWALTSLEEHTGRPEIQPWLRGWVEEKPQTAVVWRKHLPILEDGSFPQKRVIEAFFEAAPPHMSEMLETDRSEVWRWLKERAKHLKGNGSDGKTPRESEEVSAFALNSDGTLRSKFKLSELLVRGDRVKELGGATLVIDARIGGLKHGLLASSEAVLARTADDGQEWLGEGVVGFRLRRLEASEWVEPAKSWRESFRMPLQATPEGEITHWLVVEKWLHHASTEEDRSAGYPQLLDEHQKLVERHARALAKALGLEGEWEEVLALAACLHDEGKRAWRWQRAFHAPKDGVYAKTAGPIDYRFLGGYRHELGSLIGIESDRRIQELPEDRRDLVLHLIAAHHGYGRPIIEIQGCEEHPPSALEKRAQEIALRFAWLQERWRPWGLAWWEALLRAADQQASRENETREPFGGVA